MGTLLLAKSEFSNGTERAEENLWEPLCENAHPETRAPEAFSILWSPEASKGTEPTWDFVIPTAAGRAGAGSLAPAPIKRGEVVLVC